MLWSGVLWSGVTHAQVDESSNSVEGEPQEVASDAPAESQSAASSLEEVVVTATRRSTTVQETPMAISAIGGEALVNSNVSGLQDITTLVPTLTIGGGAGGGGRISMRGIRPPAGEGTVGLYYGEVPMVGPSDTTQSPGNFSQDANLFDIERVEVLRGPQGTLFGASSMGGTVRILFNQADTTTESGVVDTMASTTHHGEPGYWVKGAYNVPLIENVFAARVVLWKETKGGYVDDVNENRGVIDDYHSVNRQRSDINDSSNKGGRVMLTYTPTGAITWHGMAMHENNSDVSDSWHEALGKYKTDAVVIPETEDELRLYSSDFEWDFGYVNFNWALSYYDWHRVQSSDFTNGLLVNQTNASFCGDWWNGTGQGDPIAPDENGDVVCSAEQVPAFTSFSQSLQPAALVKPNDLKNLVNEVRISSNSDGPLNWIVGAYFERREDHVDSTIGTVSTADPDGRVDDLDDFPVFWHRFIADDIEQTAYFGDIIYKPGWAVLPGLSLNYGTRRYDYKKTTGGAQVLNGWATGNLISEYAENSADASGWLHKYNVSYEFSVPVLAYATAAKGFRPGGANQTPSLDPKLVPYQPDSVWNYELGVKSSWLDNALVLNAALYQIDWDDIQTSASTANRCCSFITNAGEAQIQGAELEVTVRPAIGLELNAGVSYNFKYELTEDQKNDDIADSLQLGLDGNEIPNVSEFNGAVSIQYNRPLTAMADGMIRVNYSYTGTSHTDFRPENPDYEKQGGFSVVNLRTGIDVQGWGFYLFISNLLDGDGVYSRTTSGTYTVDRVSTLVPRTIGFNLRHTF